MSKTIKDYLGEHASLNGTKLTLDLNDFIQIIEPGATDTATTNDANFAVALLLIALHKTSALPKTKNGMPLTDNTQAVVSRVNPQSSYAVKRNGEKQIEHEMSFNVYTVDYQTFPIDRIV